MKKQTLILTNQGVVLKGFDLLHKKVCFKFLPSGIAICKGHKTSDYSINVRITNNVISAKKLRVLLRERGLDYNTPYEFILLNDTYFEVTAHKRH